MKKYVKAERNNPNATVTIKYIIIPGVNDNMKEVKEFIKRCNKIGCHSIEINVEFFWMNENYDKPISKELKEVLQYLDREPYTVFSGNISSHIKNWLKQNVEQMY